MIKIPVENLKKIKYHNIYSLVNLYGLTKNHPDSSIIWVFGKKGACCPRELSGTMQQVRAKEAS
jgi:hypothetical protein